MKKSTLYTLCSLQGSHPTLLSQMGVLADAVMAVNILLSSLSLFIHFIFYTYYYFALILDNEESRKTMAFKTLQEAVPGFPQRELEPDSPKVIKMLYISFSDFVQNKACRNLYIPPLNWHKHSIVILWHSSLSCIFYLPSYFHSSIKCSHSTSRALRQHVIIQLNNTTAEAESSIIIPAEFSFL